MFHDALQADVEQAQRVSRALRSLPAGVAQALPYHPVEVLAIQPSVSLDALAREHADALPPATRYTLAGLGALDTRRSGSAAALASYLLFEPPFVHALMPLGRGDALRHAAALRAPVRRRRPAGFGAIMRVLRRVPTALEPRRGQQP